MTELIQAAHFTLANRGICRLIVIHTMENPEKPGTARAVARWFAGPAAPQASAHYCIDQAEVVQCVREKDVAWAAPGANRDGIHLEHAGRARQTLEEWSDEYSRAELSVSAVVAADVAARHAIPIRKLTVEQVKDGVSKGFCGHVDVTKAFGKSTHTDPGENFPWGLYLSMVEENLAPAPSIPPEGEGVAI